MVRGDASEHADRVACVHAAECAGCPLIHLDYAQQLAGKRARVVTAVSHYPALELLYTRPVTPAEPNVGYRGRAKLIVAPDGRIGLYARAGNHEVVDIPECRVLTPALADVTARVRALVASPPVHGGALLPPYNPIGGGVLRAIDVREVRLATASPWTAPAAPARPSIVAEAAEEARGGVRLSVLPPAPDDPGEIGVLLTFVLQRDRAPSRDVLVQAAHALRPLLPGVVGIAANFHDLDAPQILGPDTLPLDGASRAPDRIGQTWHLATFGSFVQAHRGQAARVHASISAAIAALDAPFARAGATAAGAVRRRVLDLYGGSGAISLAVARAGSDVVMVESFAPATANARAAADAQGLPVDVRTGDVSEAAARLAHAGERFDAVVVNPPRRGVSPAAREAIARIGAPLVVYVSCEPDTLARDLDHFARLGYTTTELSPFDMIPLTDEVETVSILRRALPAPPRVIYQDDDVIVVDKGPHEPVGHDEGDYGSSLLARCARLPGFEGVRLEPVHVVDAGTSGLCVLARSADARAAWAAALAATGRLVYLAAAKSITPAKGAIARELREGGRSYPARTRYRRLAIASGHSILRVIPDGARTHQIRRHLAAIGHPIIGDERYGHLPTNRYFEEKHGLDRSFVHLVRIEVAHPRTGARLLIESTLPGDLRSTLERATGSSVLRFLEQKHALGDQRTSSMPPPSLDGDAGEGAAEGPMSSRGSVYPGDDIAPDSLRAPPSIANPPDVDESPRTVRHAIVSGDED
jgi:23S rRNA (uracil1939-C5)-methyltransferase